MGSGQAKTRYPAGAAQAEGTPSKAGLGTVLGSWNEEERMAEEISRQIEMQGQYNQSDV